MATVAPPSITHPTAPEASTGAATATERRVGWLMAGTGLALFLVMMLLGILMRLTQADLLGLSDAWFYRLMTLHGAGMIVSSLLVMMGALWYVLRPIITLSTPRLLWAYACIVGGAVLVLLSTIVGHFATGWTFLWPLPFYSLGQWSTWATTIFLLGMAAVGVGFFIYCVDLLTSITSSYGVLALARRSYCSTAPTRPRRRSADAPSCLRGRCLGRRHHIVLHAHRVIDSDVTSNPCGQKLA